MENNNAAVLHMKRSFMELTSGPGWSYFTKFAESVVRDLEKIALAEDDDVKANSLRHDARGARKFMDDILRRVELAKSQDVNPTQDDFVDVACD